MCVSRPKNVIEDPADSSDSSRMRVRRTWKLCWMEKKKRAGKEEGDISRVGGWHEKERKGGLQTPGLVELEGSDISEEDFLVSLRHRLSAVCSAAQ